MTTTNQTIDGVPRAVLEVLLAEKAPHYTKAIARRQLRALLDAPVKPAVLDEPATFLTLSALLADLPEGYNKDDVAFGWNECVDNHRCPAAQHHDDQPVSDHQFYTAQLQARAAKVLGLDPENTSWFEVVGEMEKMANE